MIDSIKNGLAAAKARGVKLGGYRGGPKINPALGREARSARADALAEQLGEQILRWRNADLSYRAIGIGLDRRGIPPLLGAEWTATAVRRVFQRWRALAD